MEKIAHVVSIKDSYGNEQVEQFRTDLISEAKYNEKGLIKLKFFLRALNYTQNIGKNQLHLHETTLSITSQGTEYEKTFTLFKALRKQPIYELRLNFPEYGSWIRATFFPTYYEGQLYYCFVKAFTKTKKPEYDPTDTMIDETYRVYQQVRSNPEAYLSES
ncbi:hypothetical protein [Evansella clarkii]|uniref:hypothetical protein n=1 Tax=Evansella clarkii TaxID=79879 RepID=UPI000996732F|nr:hypothetical protein [Evansella clarkii]